MSTKLTKKEKGFVKDYAKTGNGVESALANYDTKDYSTAGVIAHENLKKPKIQQALEEALPAELLTEVHREGLLATKPYFNTVGEKVAEDADYHVRAKYLDMAYKRKGDYAPDRSVSVTINAEPSDRIKQIAHELNNAKRNPRGDNTSN